MSDKFDYDIDVHISDPLWAEVTSDPDGFCGPIIKTALAQLDAPRLGEVSIALLNDADIQILNREYRGKDTPTNVLSFPMTSPVTLRSMNEPIPILGDIIIARETVIREAGEKNIPVQNHLTHLLVHGVLHLQGYDHETDDEALIMEGLEIKTLKALGIDNPYVIETSNE